MKRRRGGADGERPEGTVKKRLFIALLKKKISSSLDGQCASLEGDSKADVEKVEPGSLDSGCSRSTGGVWAKGSKRTKFFFDRTHCAVSVALAALDYQACCRTDNRFGLKTAWDHRGSD